MAARLLPLLLVLPAALCPGRASAQTPGAPRLYAHTGYGLGSARQLALGGAFVGIADGAAFTANHASFAQPSPWVGTDLDGFFSLQIVSTLGGQDLDNDARVDRAGVRQLLLGTGMRYRRFGFGLYIRETHVCVDRACPPGGVGDATFRTGGLSLALSFLEGQLVTAVGMHGTQAELARHPGILFDGGGFGADLLWRPFGKPYRAGLSFRPGGLASPPEGARFDPERGPSPPGVAFPAVLSVGFAAKLDPGGEGLNVPRERDDDPTSPVAADALIRDIFRHRRERPPGRWLATFQLDLTLAVQDAVTLESYTDSAAPGAPQRVGEDALLTPRFGVEHVTAPGRLRLRAGTYVEPSPAPGVAPRLHGTFGFDLFLFHFLFDWGLTGAFDVAPRLRQGGLSFGIWG